jgi:hypothetical protein
MADDSPRALLCLIEGDSSPFRVKLAGDTDIIDLKDLIKEKRKNGVLSNVNAKDLTVWKVGTTMASDSTTNSLLQVDLAPPSRDERKDLTGKCVQGSVKLEEDLDKISYHWPVPNPECLHVVVEPPSSEHCVH